MWLVERVDLVILVAFVEDDDEFLFAVISGFLALCCDFTAELVFATWNMVGLRR